MADHVVDRGEDGLGVAVVTEVGGDGALHVHDVFVGEAVQRFGADAGHDVRLDHGQHLGGQLRGPPRHHQFVGAAEGDGARHQWRPLTVAAAAVWGGAAAPRVVALVRSRPPLSSAWISSWQMAR